MDQHWKGFLFLFLFCLELEHLAGFVKTKRSLYPSIARSNNIFYNRNSHDVLCETRRVLGNVGNVVNMYHGVEVQGK